MRFAFIAKHRLIWPVTWLCDALDVSRSGFHAWLGRSPSARAQQDEKLLEATYKASGAAIAPTAPARVSSLIEARWSRWTWALVVPIRPEHDPEKWIPVFGSDHAADNAPGCAIFVQVPVSPSAISPPFSR